MRGVVAMVMKVAYPNWVCELAMRGRCAWVWDFGHATFDLGDMTLTLGIPVQAAVPEVLMPQWPICTCSLPMRGRCTWTWNFGPAIFGLGNTILTSKGSCARRCGQGIGISVDSDVPVHRVFVHAAVVKVLKPP